MPVSNIQGGGVPGLRLLAWVLFNGANGAIVSQFNVSGVVRNAVGDYTATFANAMANTQYVVRAEFTAQATSNNMALYSPNQTAATVRVVALFGGSAADAPGVYVAVYG
jgi:hypothetical protein